MRERGISAEEVERALLSDPRKLLGAQRLCVQTHQPIRVALGDLLFVLTAGFGPFDVSIITIIRRFEDGGKRTKRQPTVR
jgi:hypothetical protein